MLTEADESTIIRLYEIWVSYDTDFDGTMSKEEFMSIPEVAASRCVIDFSIYLTFQVRSQEAIAFRLAHLQYFFCDVNRWKPGKKDSICIPCHRHERRR